MKCSPATSREEYCSYTNRNVLFTGKLKGTPGTNLVNCTNGAAASKAIVLKNTYDQWGNDNRRLSDDL